MKRAGLNVKSRTEKSEGTNSHLILTANSRDTAVFSESAISALEKV